MMLKANQLKKLNRIRKLPTILTQILNNDRQLQEKFMNTSRKITIKEKGYKDW